MSTPLNNVKPSAIGEQNLADRIASSEFMHNEEYKKIIDEVKALKNKREYVYDRDGGEYRVQLTSVHTAINIFVKLRKKLKRNYFPELVCRHC